MHWIKEKKNTSCTFQLLCDDVTLQGKKKTWLECFFLLDSSKTSLYPGLWYFWEGFKFYS